MYCLSMYPSEMYRMYPGPMYCLYCWSAACTRIFPGQLLLAPATASSTCRTEDFSTLQLHLLTWICTFMVKDSGIHSLFCSLYHHLSSL